MLWPTCPMCGDYPRRSSAWAVALDLAKAGLPVPAPLRAFLVTRGRAATVFRCECGWSGAPFVASGVKGARQGIA